MLTIVLDGNINGFHTYERTVNIPGELACSWVGEPVNTYPTYKYSRYLRSKLNRSPVCLDVPHPAPPHATGILQYGACEEGRS